MQEMNLSELSGAELRSLSDSIIAQHCDNAVQNPSDRDNEQEKMDVELSQLCDEINARGRLIAKKYKRRFVKMDVRGMKADKDAILGRAGLR